MKLSPHDDYTDTAIVIDPVMLQADNRLYDTASDLVLLLANIHYVFGFSPAIVRQWALSQPIVQGDIEYPNVVPVGSVTWFLSEDEEQLLEQAGCFERLSQDALADVMELHHLITQYGFSATSPVYTPCGSPCSDCSSMTLASW